MVNTSRRVVNLCLLKFSLVYTNHVFMAVGKVAESAVAVCARVGPLASVLTFVDLHL